MKITHLHLSRSMRVLYMGAVAWSCTTVLAAGDAAASDAAARYQRERAACTSGQSNQDLATCMREASAAYAQVRKTGMHDNDTGFDQNAQKRCEALPNGDRKACQARMQGQGSSSGSVSGGGIYRELVTTEPAVTTPAKAAGAVLPVPSK